MARLSPPSPRGNANYEIPLDMSMHIFNCHTIVEAILTLSIFKLKLLMYCTGFKI